MSTEAQAVLKAALALPLPQREELAAQLVNSLVDSPVLTPEEQAEVDSAWEDEIAIREGIADMEAGRVAPLDEVTARIRANLGLV